MNNKINVISWNCNGLKSKIHSLINFLKTHSIHIALIQETHLKPSDPISIKNYHLIRRDRDNGQGGVAILISHLIPFTQSQLPANTSIEYLAITLANDTVIVNVYNSPRNIFSQQDLTTLLSHRRTLVAGDFNARHITWNCHLNNANGNTLARYLENQNESYILYPDDPTHFPENNSTPTTIDLILNKNVPHISHPLSLPELDSDHNPILFSITHNSPIPTLQKTIRSFKNTNWNDFRTRLDELVQITPNIVSTAHLDRETILLTNAIQTAMLEHSTQKTIDPNRDDLPDDIKTLIRQRNRLRRDYQRTLDQQIKRDYNALTRQIKDSIAQDRNNKWQRKLENLKTTDNSIWKLIKALKTKKSTIPTLTRQNTNYHSDLDKANILANTFEQAHDLDLDNLTEEQRAIVEEVQTITSNPTPTPPRILSKALTTPTEIKTLLGRLPINKAPGPDEIPNQTLRNLSRKTIVQLHYIINAVLKLSHFPQSFKNAKIVPIHKPGKPKNDPSSYRPISLLNTLSKVVEKVILTRLQHVLDEHQTITDIQFGFRASHSTTHQVARITTHIATQYNKNKNTALCLLDFEKAFDRVWTDGLILKLHRQNIPNYLTKLIKSYLTDRTFNVQLNDQTSQQKQVKAGVPQGSALGPILFSLFINDIPQFDKTNMALYADDTAIYASSFHSQVAVTQVQIHHRTLLEPYFNKWKIHLNSAKTELNIFSKKFTNVKVPTPLKISGTPIFPKTPVKYLGVLLDSRLSFNPHIRATLQKAHMILKTLYPLLKSPHLSQQNKKLMFTQIIRPTLTYACPVWCAASTTAKIPLQRFQNKIMRLITNTDRYTKIDRLHELTGLPTLNTYIDIQAQKFYTKPNDNPLIQTITEIRSHNTPHKLKHKLPYQTLPIFSTQN